jgi:sulfoxide reductase heme-binding subunit YedZ
VLHVPSIHAVPIAIRGPVMRLSGRTFLILLAVVGLVIVAATDQIVPATSERQASLRIWLAARAAGITAYLLLTLQVVLGLVLAHPTNQATWRLSKRLFPWHENIWVFVLAFLGVHILTIVADPWAGVGIGGAFLPGLSEYRSSAVALGTMGLYAMLATGLTARYTKRLPAGWWLRIHRLSILVFGMVWLHGMLAGTDSTALQPMYIVTGGLVIGSAAYRHWVTRRARAVEPAGLQPESRPDRPTPRPTTPLSEPIPVEVTIR